MRIISPQGSEPIIEELRSYYSSESGSQLQYRPTIDDEITDEKCAILCNPAPYLQKIAQNSGIVLFSSREELLHLIPFGKNALLVGARRWSQEGPSAIKNKIRYYPPSEISHDSISEVCEAVMGAAKDFQNMFISINISVLDPAFASAEHEDPAGLTPREIIYFIQRLKILRNFKYVAIWGYKLDQRTTKIVAHILSELISG